MGNFNYIVSKVKPGRSSAILFAFLLLFCVQSFGAQAHHRDVTPNIIEGQVLVKHEPISLLAPNSKESKFFKASTVYNSPTSNSGNNSSQSSPLTKTFLSDSTIDLLDTNDKKVFSNPVLYKEPEGTRFLLTTLTSCSQPTIENKILSCLRTVVMLH